MIDITRIDQINPIIAAAKTMAGVIIEALSALKIMEVKMRSSIWTVATVPIPRVVIGAIIATVGCGTEITFLWMLKLTPTENGIFIILQ